MIALLNDPSDLGIDLYGGVLRVVHLLGKISTEKYLFFFLTEGHGPELLAHAPLTNHPTRQIGGLFDVIARARRHVFEHELFSDPSAKKDDEIVHQIFFAVGMFFIYRQLLG